MFETGKALFGGWDVGIVLDVDHVVVGIGGFGASVFGDDMDHLAALRGGCYCCFANGVLER